MDIDAGVERRVNRCQRRTVIDRRQPTGVAMRHDVDAFSCGGERTPQVESMLADAAALADIFLGDTPGFKPGRRRTFGRGKRLQACTHACQCPVQIDGGRTGGAEQVNGGGQRGIVGTFLHCQGDAIGRGDADQRRPAHLHVADGVCGGRQRGDPPRLVAMRQGRLVDDFDGLAVAKGTQCPGRSIVDVHGLNVFPPLGALNGFA